MLSGVEMFDKNYLLKLTETHLKKSTLNGSELVDVIGEEIGFSFDQIDNGEKVEFDAVIENTDKKTTLRFYKPKSKKEKRFSISLLSRNATAGDVLSVWIDPDKAEPIRIKIIKPDKKSLIGKPVEGLKKFLTFGK